MHSRFAPCRPRGSSPLRRLVPALLGLSCSCLPLAASVPPSVPAADIAPYEPGEIGRTVIDHGDHRTVLIELVSDPARRRIRPAPTAPAPVAPAPSPSTEPATAPEKAYHNLSWRITVYPGAPLCSVVEGGEIGREWRIVSGIDFRLLCAFPIFETKDAFYDWSPLIGEDEPDSPARLAFLAAGAPPANGYRSQRGAPGVEDRDALDHLHAYHAAHHAELLRADALRRAEAERIERELRENPPRPPDNIVRYTTPIDHPVNPAASAR